MNRKLPTALEKAFKTAVGDENGPNVMTGYDEGATNCIIESFLRSICNNTDFLTVIIAITGEISEDRNFKDELLKYLTTQGCVGKDT